MHLKNKFESLLKNSNKRSLLNISTHIKPAVLNFCDDDIPLHHSSLLNLGPKFVPTPKTISTMDNISITEVTALKMTYSKNKLKARKLRQDVLRIVKIAKPLKNNLTKLQLKLLKRSAK